MDFLLGVREGSSVIITLMATDRFNKYTRPRVEISVA